MIKAVRSLLLSFRGRISRNTFWWSVILLGSLFVALFVVLETILGWTSTLAIYPPFFWAMVALAVKRMRDRGRSPIWLLTILIPIAGPLWLFIELGLRRGTPGENQHGPDPRELEPEYLTVK
jgi:uncharacterized membrane protein YhaH (DUF805 family)